MELRHLRYFVTVAEELHFGRAAQKLGMSQPPLSLQIQTLEAELGIRLFERTSRSVALSEAGRIFLKEARATLTQADRAIEVARRTQRGELGELAISFTPSAPFVPAVARAIFGFRQRHPDVELRLSELSNAAQIAALQRGAIDIGFLRDPNRPALPEGLAATRIVDERLFVAMRPDHRLADRATLAFDNLDGEKMILYARHQSGGFTEQLLKMLRRHGVEPEMVQDVSEISTLLGLVVAGLGITILAESLCAMETAHLVYRPLAEEDAVSSLWVLSAARTPTPQAQLLLEMLAADLPVAIPPA